MANYMDLNHEDRVVSYLPLSHIAAQVCLCVHACVCACCGTACYTCVCVCLLRNCMLYMREACRLQLHENDLWYERVEHDGSVSCMGGR
jgi:hypothetical protein